MKKMGLKGFKPQEFLLNHGEKLAFGLFALIAVMALAGTEWKRFDLTPEKIISDVSAARTRITSQPWPADKQATFGLLDYAGKAQQVRGPMNVSPYEYSTNLWWPLYRKQELAKDPEYLAVTDLIATPGVFALPVASKTATVAMAAEGSTPEGVQAVPGQPAAADPNFDPQFSPSRAAPATGGGAFPGGIPAAHGAGAVPLAAGMAPPPAMAHDGMGAFGGEMGYGSMGTPGVTPRGERFVAVRGIWPLWQQMEKYQKALNLQQTSDARNFLLLLDFVLERQTALAGNDPWSGPWDTVDVQRALDVLDEASDYAIDPVDPQITDVVVTMPLPARLVGVWGDLATHPKIKNFELPPAELAKQRKIEEKLIEEYEKYRLQEEAKTIRPRGFFGRTRNIRQMAETMYGSEYGSTFETDMRTMMAADPTVRITPAQLKMQLTAVGRLILFRFFDFEVRPGFAYRYRVKLKLRNPNFERPLDQVLDQSVAEGPERETPWSANSNVAVIPESVNYFLTDVERDPVLETKPAASKVLARVDFFEWDPTVGTMIHDPVELKSFGQFISQTRESLQLNVATPSLRKSEVTFRSDDLLLDVIADNKIDTEMNKDLKLAPTLRGKVGITPEAIIVDEAGNLAPLDPTKDKAKHDNLTKYVERERAPFKHLEGQEAKPQGMLEGGSYPGMPAAAGAGMDEYSMMMGGAGAAGKTKGRSKNPRKPQGSMPQGSMPPGAHAP